MAPEGQALQWDDDHRRPLNAETWERPSDIAGQLDKGDGLKPYESTRTAIGIARDKGLYAQFRALCCESPDPWNSAKDECKALVLLAQDIGGAQTQSGLGTAFHRYCHVIDEGGELEYLAEELEPWLYHYQQVMKRFEVLADERFVRTDAIKCAGNFDRLLRDRETGEVYVADIKSGAWDAKFCMKCTIQLAIYANGRYYNQQTGACEDFECSTTTGLLIHAPIASGNPECTIYRQDITEGWRLAKQAVDTVAARKMKALKRDIIVQSKESK